MNYRDIISKFDIAGDIEYCEPHGNGHINRTFLVKVTGGKRYILQALNRSVFKNPAEVMSNIYKVTEFLRKGGEDPRTTVAIVKLKGGELYYNDGESIWRMLDFVEDSICLERPESTTDFYECAVAFGTFQRRLSGFDASVLFETIPDFHNTEKRYAAFCEAVEKDVCKRCEGVKDEIAFVKERKEFCSVLRKAALPLRVTHNDTKCNNVMLDKATRTALCVIDLDTIMPGLSVNDFGDAIRFGASTAAEDEKDIIKVSMDLDMFKAYAKGFINGCGGSLTENEILHFPEGAKMMTLECGMRFLTDYLSGDTYFKTAYPTHNLDRCRTQFKLVSDMEAKWDEMKAIIKSLI